MSTNYCLKVYFNTEVKKIVQKFFKPFRLTRLLAWDRYEAHMTKGVSRRLTESVIGSGGCTKYIQATGPQFEINRLNRRKQISTMNG